MLIKLKSCFHMQFDPESRFLFRHHLKNWNKAYFLEKLTLVRTSDFTKFCSNVSGLHEEEMRMPVGESGQIKYVGLFFFLFFFLVGHPTQALQSHIEIWPLCKNTLKAEASLFLWNETCSCCKKKKKKCVWHKKGNKNSTGDDSRGKKRHLCLSFHRDLKISAFFLTSFLPSFLRCL